MPMPEIATGLLVPAEASLNCPVAVDTRTSSPAIAPASVARDVSSVAAVVPSETLSRVTMPLTAVTIARPMSAWVAAVVPGSA